MLCFEHWKSRRALHLHHVLLSFVSIALLFAGSSAFCQLSFASAMDLSLQNSSRVKLTEDEVDKAAALGPMSPRELRDLNLRVA